jgi:putative redox protein
MDMPESRVRAPVVVTHESGLKFVAQVRSHRIIVDQPERAGGEDAGPTPLELMAFSLGSCVALYVQQFCHSRGLTYDGMRVEVDSIGATAPNRLGELVVRVHLPIELSPHLRTMIERAATSCPAHHTLELGAKVTVHIEAAAAVA